MVGKIELDEFNGMTASSHLAESKSDSVHAIDRIKFDDRVKS